MGEENERKKGKKCVNHVREKCETKLVNEYYSSELVSNFTHQNFLVKMVRLQGVVFLVFSSNWLTNFSFPFFFTLSSKIFFFFFFSHFFLPSFISHTQWYPYFMDIKVSLSWHKLCGSFIYLFIFSFLNLVEKQMKTSVNFLAMI
jgi:ABC-type multidrug transport system fused ATPase/permease subunit